MVEENPSLTTGIESSTVVVSSVIPAVVVAVLLALAFGILYRYQVRNMITPNPLKIKLNTIFEIFYFNNIKQIRRLAFQGIEDLLKGKPDKINPNVPLDKQRNLLPYDKSKWELPRESLKLG